MQRYDPSMFEVSSPLSAHVGDIDAVYLDNTFCSPDCVFPSREDVREEILELIRSFPEHEVVIGTRSLGKESLLVWLAGHLQEWISVTRDTFSVAEILRLPAVLKVQDPGCRIRTVPFHLVCKKNMRKWNEAKPTVAVLPSAIFTGIGGEPFVNQSNVFVVPYSDHSSFAELKAFVSRLKPSKVIPIVVAETKGPFGVSLKARADMSVFGQFCMGTDKRRRTSWFSNPSQNTRGSAMFVCKPRLLRSTHKSRLRNKIAKGVQYNSEEIESVVDLGKDCFPQEVEKAVDNDLGKLTPMNECFQRMVSLRVIPFPSEQYSGNYFDKTRSQHPEYPTEHSCKARTPHEFQTEYSQRTQIPSKHQTIHSHGTHSPAENSWRTSDVGANEPDGAISPGVLSLTSTHFFDSLHTMNCDPDPPQATQQGSNGSGLVTSYAMSSVDGHGEKRKHLGDGKTAVPLSKKSKCFHLGLSVKPVFECSAEKSNRKTIACLRNWLDRYQREAEQCVPWVLKRRSVPKKLIL